MLKPTSSTKTEPALTAPREITGMFGCPAKLIPDKGTFFGTKYFEEFCEYNEIQHIKAATATARPNSQVERYNSTIILSYKSEDGSDWNQRLTDIQFSLKSSKNKTTKRSPHELLFSFQLRNALQNKIMLTLENDMTAT